MPVQFGLALRSSPSDLVSLHEVDEYLCSVFGCEVHPTQWIGGWYNSLGSDYACNGQGFDPGSNAQFWKRVTRNADYRCYQSTYPDWLEASQERLTFLIRAHLAIRERYCLPLYGRSAGG